MEYQQAHAWILEIYRILMPGGIAFLTARYKSYFDYFQMLHKSADVFGFAGGAHIAFRDIETARKEYEAGCFCSDAQGSRGEGLTPVYRESFISPKYAFETNGQKIAVVGFEDSVRAGLLDQATFWLKY